MHHDDGVRRIILLLHSSAIVHPAIVPLRARNPC